MRRAKYCHGLLARPRNGREKGSPDTRATRTIALHAPFSRSFFRVRARASLPLSFSCRAGEGNTKITHPEDLRTIEALYRYITTSFGKKKSLLVAHTDVTAVTKISM